MLLVVRPGYYCYGDIWVSVIKGKQMEALLWGILIILVFCLYQLWRIVSVLSNARDILNSMHGFVHDAATKPGVDPATVHDALSSIENNLDLIQENTDIN